MPFRCKHSVCVVTGGASGIGRALCHCLANAGAKHVVVVDLIQETEKVANELPRGVGIPMMADCGVEADIRRIILETEHKCGNIDAFFANAGVSGFLGSSMLGGDIDVTDQEWDKLWQVNVMQSVYVARHLFPKFVRRGSGTLVVTASAAGLLTLAGNLPYSVTKHAAVAVAEWLQTSYADRGIQVSCLCPQAVQTNMLFGVDPTSVWGGKILSAQEVAKITVNATTQGTFMILPHEEVAKYFKFKGKDYEGWIRGMQKVHAMNRDTFQKLPRTKPSSKL